ncbi:MAG: PilN domain-containing protein [Acidobacteria bacterium]|nr:PilN domain-containing protein [Acidobacteriota bacterium]
MIRINLLEKRQKAPEKASALTTVSIGGAASVAAAAIIVLAFAFVGWQYYQYSSRISTLDTEIKKADQDIAELKKALKAVDEYQLKKKALEKRVDLISDLKRRQKVPVHLLDQISSQLPDFLWLEQLDEKESAISIRGKATTYNAVSNFYNNLKDSAFFRDVTLGNTQRAPEGVSFSMSCKFVAPQSDEPAAAPPAPAPAAAPRG